MKVSHHLVIKSLRIAIIMLSGLALFLFISLQMKEQTADAAPYRVEMVRSPFDNKVYAVKIPAQMDFAGEAVPLADDDVRERFDRELLINTYWHSQTLYIMKEYPQIISLIEPILIQNGVPKDFVYLCIAESGLQYNAQSPSGAIGLWQFLKPTAQSYGLTVNSEVDERYSYERSTEAACKYLKEAKEKFGSWTMAAAAFNNGMGGINQVVERQQTNDYYDLYLNRETARYIYRILALKQILQNPQQYGFFLETEDLYPEHKYRTVIVDSAITNLTAFAKIHGTSYKTLRLLNPWLISYSLTNKEKKKYQVKLPI